MSIVITFYLNMHAQRTFRHDRRTDAVKGLLNKSQDSPRLFLDLILKVAGPIAYGLLCTDPRTYTVQ